MSKAEERALEKYPAHKSVFDKYEKQRYAFICGYIQAEKDLELGWEDISIIRQIMFDYNRTIRNEMTIPNDEEYCQEVLKRFNKERKEK